MLYYWVVFNGFAIHMVIGLQIYDGFKVAISEERCHYHIITFLSDDAVLPAPFRYTSPTTW